MSETRYRPSLPPSRARARDWGHDISWPRLSSPRAGRAISQNILRVKRALPLWPQPKNGFHHIPLLATGNRRGRDPRGHRGGTPCFMFPGFSPLSCMAHFDATGLLLRVVFSASMRVLMIHLSELRGFNSKHFCDYRSYVKLIFQMSVCSFFRSSICGYWRRSFEKKWTFISFVFCGSLHGMKSALKNNDQERPMLFASEAPVSLSFKLSSAGSSRNRVRRMTARTHAAKTLETQDSQAWTVFSRNAISRTRFAKDAANHPSTSLCKDSLRAGDVQKNFESKLSFRGPRHSHAIASLD